MDREIIAIKGKEVLSTVKKLVKQGNIRRIIVKHKTKIILDIPLTLGVVGAVFAPIIAGAAFVLALVKDCTIEIEKDPNYQEETKDKESQEK